MSPWNESFELLKSIDDSDNLDKSFTQWLTKFGKRILRKLGIGSEEKVKKKVIGAPNWKQTGMDRARRQVQEDRAIRRARRTDPTLVEPRGFEYSTKQKSGGN